MAGGKIPTKNVWVTFADASDCPPGNIISGFQYGIEVAFVNKGGSFYGFSNKMPPTGQPTTFASVEGDCLVEPITSTKFALKSGKQTGPWCPGGIGKLIIGRLVSPTDLDTFSVRKQGNKLQALINVNAKAQFESNYWRGILDAQGKVDGGYY